MHIRAVKAKQNLLLLPNEVLLSPTTILVLLEQTQARLLAKLLEDKESHLKQKSRIQWLKEGDQNTKFSHNRAKGKLSRNKINVLHCVDGRVTANEAEVKSEILDFYQNLLETEDISCTCGDISILRALLPIKLSK